MIRVSDWLASARQQLSADNPRLQTDSPRLDAELLLCKVLNRTRSWLFAHDDHLLEAADCAALDALLMRRLNGEPIAWLVGQRSFWTLDLEVSPATLIPRPDTETLVEWALELPLPALARVLDLGTGTGAIALALASEQPGWQVEGLDFSADAVALAARNGARHDLCNARFYQSDWFAEARGPYQLVVSNPPYIDAQDPHLVQGDVSHEPRSALVAGNQGMADLHLLIQQAPDYLATDGWLLMEHGYQQADVVCQALRERGFVDVATRKDLGGNPRISGGRWPQQILA